jgi:vesicular inhibitory amino acid transporter
MFPSEHLKLKCFSLNNSGWAGAALILMFTVNAAFIGSRLGLCWVILEERYEEFRREIRDPYPSIGEKAVGRWGR